MIRKGKSYVRPKKAYEATRIKEENVLMEKYALKNKREIWKMAAKVAYFRRRAKALAKSPQEEQEVLFGKLKGIGLNANSIADVLALTILDLLERRLPTVVFKKNLAKTVKQARQMVVHKKVMVEGNAINIPSYIVPVALEGSITLRQNKPKAKKAEAQAPAEQAQEANEAQAHAPEAK